MSRGEAFRLLLVLMLGVLAGVGLTRHFAQPDAPAVMTSDKAGAATPSEKAIPLDVTPQGNESTASDSGKSDADGGHDDQPKPDAEAGNETPADPGFDAEVVMYDQHRQMTEALAKLKPQTPGKTDLYFLAFGGDGSEDVFRNEADYAERLMTTRFDAAGHTLALINNVSTVQTRPLATWSNLELALDGIEKVMDPAEDVLVLFLTSHGGEDHVLLVDLDPLPLDQLGADDLADILAKHHFRWRVVIVSACYSGGFIAPLRNATTMVVTASRKDRTSFGCGSDADITWFGRAFFAEGLNQSDSFAGAFDIARRLIDEWETRDGETHSEPQLASTPLIDARLKDWRSGIQLGPTLPFVAPPASGDTLTAKRD